MTTEQAPGIQLREQPLAEATLAYLQRLFDENRFQECVDAAALELSRAGRHPILLAFAAMSLAGLGRDADALTLFDEALAAAPDAAQIWTQRGLALSRLGRHDDAHASLLQAQQLSEPDADVLAALGSNLLDASRYGDARNWLRRAIEVDATHVAARVALGNTYRRMGDLDAAAALFEETLALCPANPALLLELANVLAEGGKFGEAEVKLLELIELAPADAAAWRALVLLRKMTNDDRPWLEKIRELAEGPLPVRLRSQLYYAMGKFHDDLGEFDKAFASYARANELKRSLARPYDQSAVTRTVDLFIQSHTAEMMRTERDYASDSERPLLVVGMPRSGTSLVEQILSSHPAVHGAGELNFWGEELDRFRRAIFLAQYDDKVIGQITRDCLADLKARSESALRVVDKMPANFRFLGPIHVAFPKARIIHLQRNPIDTCLSIHFQDFGLQHTYATDLANLTHYYREYQRLMAHWRSVLPAHALLEVQYEALVEDPEHWTRRMIEFCGLEWDDRCLIHHSNERRVGTASQWQVRQPIYRGSRERWRNYGDYIGPLAALIVA